MEDAARRFARRILALHLLVLVIVIACVVLAARQVYQRARVQAIANATQQQELLASQTARGIESFYDSILDNLDLIRRGDQETDQPAAPPPPDRVQRQRAPLGMAPLLWHQLEGRASMMFGVVRATGRIVAAMPRDRAADAQKAATDLLGFLRTIESPTVSRLEKVGDQWAQLVCVPMPGPAGLADDKMVLVAVVPAQAIEGRFLDNLNRENSLVATLVDETGVDVASSRHESVGQVFLKQPDESVLSPLIDKSSAAAARATGQIDSRLVTAEPLLIGTRHWLLVVRSQLSGTDAVVAGIFRSALGWSIFLVLAVTLTLVSTATQSIRSRLRIERIRHELLAAQLKQARQIQLAWLPADRVVAGTTTIAAANEPASHISGDFYDWFDLADGRTVVTIGDVTGHGMSAAFLMATTQLLIRTTMQQTADPGRSLQEVNRHLCAQVFNGQFVTALILVLDPDRASVRIATAGHFPPLLDDGQHVRALPLEAQLVLGVEADEAYASERFDLPERFSLLLFTDGVSEACSPSGEHFSIRRICAALQSHPLTPQAAVDTVVTAVKHFSNAHEFDDDLTLVAIRGQAVSSAIAAA